MLRRQINLLPICLVVFAAACGIEKPEPPEGTALVASNMDAIFAVESQRYRLELSKVADVKVGQTFPFTVKVKDCAGLVTDSTAEVTLSLKRGAEYRELARSEIAGGMVYFDVTMQQERKGYVLQAEATINGERVKAESGPFNASAVPQADFYVYPQNFATKRPGEVFTVLIVSKHKNVPYELRNDFRVKRWLQVQDRYGQRIDNALAMWNTDNIYDVSKSTAPSDYSYLGRYSDDERLQHKYPQDMLDRVFAVFDVFFTEEAVGKDVSNLVGFVGSNSSVAGASVRVIPHNNRIRMSAKLSESEQTTIVYFSQNPNPVESDPWRIKDTDKIDFISLKQAPYWGQVFDRYKGYIPVSGKNALGFWVQPLDFTCIVGGQVLVRVQDQVYQSRCIK